MKKTFLVMAAVVAAMMLFAVSAEAKSYKALCAEVSAEIPDDAVLPPQETLGFAYSMDAKAEDDAVLKIFFYEEKGGVRYFQGAIQLPAFVEVIKWDQYGIHLIRITYFDPRKGRLHLADKTATHEAAKDRLEWYVPEN